MESRPSIRRDIISAYAASGARVLSWVFVTAIVFRRLGAADFAMLALVRTTIGLLNYTTLGLAPAMIRLLAVENAPRPVIPLGDAGVIDYATPLPVGRESKIYSSAIALAVLCFVIGAVLASLYADFFSAIHRMPAGLRDVQFAPSHFAFMMGLGTVFRLTSDSAGAVLQARGRIATDNLLVGGAELGWMVLTVLAVKANGELTEVGEAWLISSAILLIARFIGASEIMGRGAFSPLAISTTVIWQLLSFGLLVAAAQMADFLYAPTDNILINRLINPETVAVYAPAIQIDAGLLLLVGGMAAVLLPRSAIAHAAEDLGAVRRYYVVGTLASGGLLAVAALAVWAAAPAIFRLWLHDPMIATQAILPMVLIHTVVGGSSAVGRSILLGIGKVKPFTGAVLVAGATNVILSYYFAKYAHLGLKGIVLGTIVAVVGRCTLWMPWYVLRVLKDQHGEDQRVTLPAV